MDDCPLVTARKKVPFQISWSGSAAALQNHTKTILSALGHGQIQWKRHEKPVTIKFDLKLVPFSLDLVAQLDEAGFCSSIAFVHLFFIDVSSADEYRSSVRHIVSEWFGQLTKASNTHWLIVYDSDKAREKRNRGSVLERIKSDFARFLDHIVEVSEAMPSTSGGIGRLDDRVLSLFVTGLDKFVVVNERAYSELKTGWAADEWSIATTVNQQFNLCRFYSSLGLPDLMLAEIDRVDQLIHELIDSAPEPQPRWMTGLKLTGFGDTCPLLRLLIHVDGVPADVSLIELRTFLLANQIFALFQIFDQRRSKVLSPSSPRSNENVRSMLSNDFANIIMRYAFAATKHLVIEIDALKINYEPQLIQAWNLLITTDVLELTEFLAELETLKHGIAFLCQLLAKQSQAIVTLTSTETTSKGREVLASWLKATVVQRYTDVLGSKTAEMLSVLRRTFIGEDVEDSPNQGQTLEEVADQVLRRAIELLRQYGSTRISDVFEADRLGILRQSGTKSEDLSSAVLDFLERLFLNCRVTAVLVDHCESIVSSHIEDIRSRSGLYFNIVILLALASKNNHHWIERLISDVHSAAFAKSSLRRYNFDSPWPLPNFPVQITRTPDAFVSTLVNAPTTLTLRLRSGFGSVIPGTRMRAVFRRLLKGSVEPLQYMFSSNPVGNESLRLGCLNKNLLAKDDAFESLHRSFEIEDADQIVFTSDPETSSLSPGDNDVQFNLTTANAGWFILNHVEVDLGPALCFVLHMQEEIRQNHVLDNVLCSIDVRKPSVVVAKTENTPLLAGVVQTIELTANAGTRIIESPTVLTVAVSTSSTSSSSSFSSATTTTTDGLRLCAPGQHDWLPEVDVALPPLGSHAEERVIVGICLAIDEMHFSAEEVQILQRQIRVQWLDFTWVFDLQFLPVMSLKMSTTIIENRVLLAVDVTRSDPVTALSLKIKDVELTQRNTDDDKPQPATLVNKRLETIPAQSAYRIVWELPDTGDVVDAAVSQSLYLRITYDIARARSFTGSYGKFSIPESAFERDYSFVWQQELPIARAEYDICAQIVSEQSELSRVDIPCSLLVSLRLLASQGESRVAVIVDADTNFWSVTEKHAFAMMKESGVGQVAFSMTPKQVGMLPYPSVYVHRVLPGFVETTDPSAILGERLYSYHRLQGRQFRVLPAKQNADDTLSVGSGHGAAGSLRLAIKERSFLRLKKFIDRDRDHTGHKH